MSLETAQQIEASSVTRHLSHGQTESRKGFAQQQGKNPQTEIALIYGIHITQRADCYHLPSMHMYILSDN